MARSTSDSAPAKFRPIAPSSQRVPAAPRQSGNSAAGNIARALRSCALDRMYVSGVSGPPPWREEIDLPYGRDRFVDLLKHAHSRFQARLRLGDALNLNERSHRRHD